MTDKKDDRFSTCRLDPFCKKGSSENHINHGNFGFFSILIRTAPWYIYNTYIHIWNLVWYSSPDLTSPVARLWTLAPGSIDRPSAIHPLTRADRNLLGVRGWLTKGPNFYPFWKYLPNLCHFNPWSPLGAPDTQAWVVVLPHPWHHHYHRRRHHHHDYWFYN